MSIPKHDTKYGTLIYQGREYTLLNNPLPKELIGKYDQLDEEVRQPYCSAQWMNQQTRWEIRDQVLYFVEMFDEGILPLLIGENEMKATWVDMLAVHIATEIPLDRDGYRHTKEVVYFLELRFNDARHIATQKKEGKGFFDQSRRMVKYIGRQEGLYRFDTALLSFVEGSISLNAHGTIAEYMTNDLMLVGGSVCLERMLRDVDQVLYLCETIALHFHSDIPAIANRIVSTLSLISHGDTAKYCMFCHAEEDASTAVIPVETLEHIVESMKQILDRHEDDHFDLPPIAVQGRSVSVDREDGEENAPRMTIQIFVGL